MVVIILGGNGQRSRKIDVFRWIAGFLLCYLLPWY